MLVLGETGLGIQELSFQLFYKFKLVPKLKVNLNKTAIINTLDMPKGLVEDNEENRKYRKELNRTRVEKCNI